MAVRLAPIADVADRLRADPIAARGLTAGGALAALAVLGLTFRALRRRAVEPLELVEPEDDAARRWVSIEETLVVDCTPKQAYRFWRRFDNLREHMESVEDVSNGGRTLHWRQRGPAGLHAEWEATVTEDRRKRRISWRSTTDSPLPTVGHVSFHGIEGAPGTLIRLVAEFRPPAGQVGAFFGRMMRPMIEQQLRTDLRRVRDVLEAQARA